MRFALGVLCVYTALSLSGCDVGGTHKHTDSSRADRFFQRALDADRKGLPIQPAGMLGRMSINLLEQYVPIDANVSQESLPYYVAVGMRRMYLQATLHEEAGEAQFILNRMREQPAEPYWANCGSSVDLMIIFLASFGVDARAVSIWHTINDGHVVLEYYSEQYGRYVLYDPLYGTYMLDKQGYPAGIADIMAQIRRYGFNSRQWEYQPVRIFDLFSDVYAPAASPEYEYYNSLEYHIILDNYFQVVAVRKDDYTPFQYLNLGTLPGESLIRGTWEVYSFLTGAERTAMEESLLDLYDSARGGRYMLNLHPANAI